MRKPADILARIELVEQTDSMGSQTDILILALPYEDAKPFIDDTVTPAQWATDCPELHDDACEKLIQEAVVLADAAFEAEKKLETIQLLGKIRSLIWLKGDDFVLNLFECQAYAGDKIKTTKSAYPITT